MAGIGVKLNKIFGRNTIASSLYGFVYSTVITIAPMMEVFLAVVLMERLLNFSSAGYTGRALFSCTLLYSFIFSVLMVSPLNPVLSRFMSDTLYEDCYDDILPCFYAGLLMAVILSCCVSIPFFLHEHFVGGVPVYYVFTSFCEFISLVMVVYDMLYLSITKDYKRIALLFFVGMLVGVLCSLAACYLFRLENTYSGLLGLTVGLLVTAVLEHGQIQQFFPENSGRYRLMLSYFLKYWKLAVSNFLYVLGLYLHNFVFWTTDMRTVVARSFVCMEPYDVATCVAMFTNVAATVIFISRVEMRFHTRYRTFTEAVIGGRWMDIKTTERKMFRQMAWELLSLVRIQFIITVAVYFLCVLLLPYFGYGGLVLEYYHCLAAGYFPLFIMYSAILFLFYFNDQTGALLTTILFCLVMLVGSVIGTHLPYLWGGIGVFAGSIAGFLTAYFRLRWLERHLEAHIFCKGTLLKRGVGRMPSSIVVNRRNGVEESRGTRWETS